MRSGQLSPELRAQLRDRLCKMLEQPDEEGFRQPFAALVLSEIARTDRMGMWMSSKERLAMVKAATNYLRSVQDYRGFDDEQGWRHAWPTAVTGCCSWP